MIKALFFDLDGTLLTSKKTILPSTYEALSRCHKMGIRVFFNTARSPLLGRMIGWGEREFSLFDGGIYCNGACEQVGGRFEYAYLEPDIISFAIAQVGKYDGLHLAMHTEDEVHIFNHYLPDDLLMPWGITRDMAVGLDAQREDRTVKILIYYDHLVDTDKVLPSELFSIFGNYCLGRANVYLTDKGKTIQIVNNKVTKLTSIEKLRLSLELAPDEIAVFGDDVNDIEMLSAYKNSVAMGNAEESVKAVSTFVTTSNDEGGIEYALREILKII